MGARTEVVGERDEIQLSRELIETPVNVWKVIDLGLRAKDEGNLSKRGNGFGGVHGLMGGFVFMCRSLQ
jgi:hypothetical protein